MSYESYNGRRTVQIGSVRIKKIFLCITEAVGERTQIEQLIQILGTAIPRSGSVHTMIVGF